MKKLFLSLAVVAFSAVNAQTEKGNWVITGSSALDFVNAKNSNVRTSTFALSPSAGYFFVKNLAGGLDLNFTSSTTKIGSVKTSQSSFAITPTIRYYFSTDTKFRPFLGLGAGYVSVTTETPSFDYYNEELTLQSEKSTNDGFAWEATGGATYFATDNLGINLGLSYGRVSDPSTGAFGLKAGISYFIK